MVAPRVDEAIRTEKVVINTVIVMELAHFLIKNLGTIEGAEQMNVFLSFPFTIDTLDYALVLRAVELLRRYTHQGVGGRDATILATAEKLSVSKLMTHDEAFRKIEWIETIDPVAKRT